MKNYKIKACLELRKNFHLMLYFMVKRPIFAPVTELLKCEQNGERIAKGIIKYLILRYLRRVGIVLPPRPQHPAL